MHQTRNTPVDIGDRARCCDAWRNHMRSGDQVGMQKERKRTQREVADHESSAFKTNHLQRAGCKWSTCENEATPVFGV